MSHTRGKKLLRPRAQTAPKEAEAERDSKAHGCAGQQVSGLTLERNGKNGQESEKDPGDGSVRQRPRKHQPSTHIAITNWTDRGPSQHCNNAALMLTFVLDPTSTITTMLLHARTVRHVYSKISPMSPHITLYNLYNLYNRIYPRYTPISCEALQRPKTWVTRQSGFDCIPSQHFAFWPTHAGQVFRRPLCPSLRYTTPRKKGLLYRVMFRVQGG